jgi:ectoine hydroxylase-related dioxygenase (phytanoyl-CoA dioxygenase family)
MKSLSPAAVSHYNDRGYYAPVRVLSPAEASAMRGKLEAHERAHGPLKGPMRHKSHLLFTWLDDLIRHPAILDAVEDVIGPNILCWSSSFFIKEPRDPGFVSWHQDSTYWGLDPADIITAWVALSESSAENGAMRVIPDSQKLEQIPHRDTFAADNLLTRGQEIAVEVDEAKAVMLALLPGEMSIHHVRLIHGSEPNPSGKRRIGFAIRYLPTHVRQIVGTHDSATLVRGVDVFHNFEPEGRPDADLSEAALAVHARVTGEQQKVMMRDTKRATYR